MNTRGRTLVQLAESLWLPGLIVTALWFLSAHSTSFAFPSLQSICTALTDEWLFAKFTSDFVPSVFIVVQALAIAILVGVGLGVPLGCSPTAEAAFRPLLDFMRGLPKVLLISPALVIIGVGDGLALSVLSFGAVWPILLAAVAGVQGIPTTLHDLRRSYRLTHSTWLLRVAFPAAMPQIFAGIRTAVALAVVLLVPAQAVGATSGLGFQLRQAADLFQFPEVWAAVIMFAALGVALNLLLAFVERRVLYWFDAQGGPV